MEIFRNVKEYFTIFEIASPIVRQGYLMERTNMGYYLKSIHASISFFVETNDKSYLKSVKILTTFFYFS